MYGSPNASLRNFLCQDLASNSIDLSDPWLAVRDFHSVTSSTEVSSNSRISNRRSAGFVERSAGFVEWIFDHGLIDMWYYGSKFTWSSG